MRVGKHKASHPRIAPFKRPWENPLHKILVDKLPGKDPSARLSAQGHIVTNKRKYGSAKTW